MKINFVIIVLLALSFCRLLGQDIEPAQQKVYYCGDSLLIDNQSAQFTIDTVVTGWMWGSKKIISKALGCTQSDNWYQDKFTYIADHSNMFVRSNPWQNLYCDHGHGDAILMARAMVFNPVNHIGSSPNASKKIMSHHNNKTNEDAHRLAYVKHQPYG